MKSIKYLVVSIKQKIGGRWFHSGDSPVEPECKLLLFYANLLML
jgi:hypothetical protein